MQSLMNTIEDLNRINDEDLIFEMLYRDFPFTEHTTRAENIQILQHQMP